MPIRMPTNLWLYVFPPAHTSLLHHSPSLPHHLLSSIFSFLAPADSFVLKIQIIVPNEQAVRKLASEQSLIDSADSAEWKEVCQSSEVSKAVLAEMNGVGKKAGLKPLEVRYHF